MGAVTDVANPGAAFLMLGATICTLGAMYVVCYTFFMATWEGWGPWSARTGLDADRADEERARHPRPE